MVLLIIPMFLYAAEIVVQTTPAINTSSYKPAGYSVEDYAVPQSFEYLLTNYSVFTIDMDISPDGNIYSLCRTGYYSGIPGENYLMIVKWTSNGRYLWHTLWNESDYISASDLAVNAEGIYVTGSIPSAEGNQVFLVKFDHQGNFLWVKYWRKGESQHGSMINFDAEGCVYVGVVMLWEYPPHDTWNHTDYLLKYDIEGSLVWEKTIETNSQYPSTVHVLITHENRIFVVTPYIARELVANEWMDVWSIDNFTYTLPVEDTPDGSFIAPEFRFPYGVSWINSSGSQIWKAEPQANWDEIINNFLSLGGFDAAPDNSVYVLCAINFNSENPTLVLTKYNSDGFQVWNRSLIYDFALSPNCIGDIEVSKSGNIYIASTAFDVDLHRYFTVLTIYNIGEFTPYWITSTSTQIPATIPEIPLSIGLTFIALSISIFIIYKFIHANISSGWSRHNL